MGPALTAEREQRGKARGPWQGEGPEGPGPAEASDPLRGAAGWGRGGKDQTHPARQPEAGECRRQEAGGRKDWRGGCGGEPIWEQGSTRDPGRGGATSTRKEKRRETPREGAGQRVTGEEMLSVGAQRPGRGVAPGQRASRTGRLWGRGLGRAWPGSRGGHGSCGSRCEFQPQAHGVCCALSQSLAWVGAAGVEWEQPGPHVQGPARVEAVATLRQSEGWKPRVSESGGCFSRGTVVSGSGA